MSFLLGLTGSIGMGKTTTAQMFVDMGVPVWDADAAVHGLYAPGGAAVAPIQEVLPDVVVDGAVSRPLLKDAITADPLVFATLEGIVHPLVAADRSDYITSHDDPILLLDIPLLFEINADSWLDAVAVVSVDPDTQRARVLARPDMTQDQFASILGRQLPDDEKRARADYIIPTDTLDGARDAVQHILTEIRSKTYA
jgi:dephospho-CoA kinase